MSRESLRFTALIVVLVIVIAGIVFYSAEAYRNSSPTPTPVTTPSPSDSPIIAVTPTPTNQTIAPSNPGHTITYSELSRNETMIVIQFKLEPNSYIFQLNATSVYLTQGSAKISANTNEAVVIGTQYSTLVFPVNAYNGIDYHLSSDKLPSDANWIRQ